MRIAADRINPPRPFALTSGAAYAPAV